MNLKTIRDIDVKDKTVIVRTDYNVPLNNGQVASDLRIRESLPTINYLRENGAKRIVLISHLGRPDGKYDPELSLSKVMDSLQKLISDEEVTFCANLNAEMETRLVLLENLRFDAREEENSDEFIEEIIDFVKPDFYVQDGFAVIHRKHASTDAVAKFLPVYAGLLLEKEIKNLSNLVEKPEKPFVAVIGGSKVEDKQPLIEKFLETADKIIVGGKIAADGYKSDNEKIFVADDFDEDLEGHKLDVGPISMVEISKILSTAKTIVWNGLLGKAEDPAYATSSTEVAKILGEAKGVETVICGGDTTGFVDELLQEYPDLKYSLISTGGGAALEFLLGKELPGIEVIETK